MRTVRETISEERTTSRSTDLVVDRESRTDASRREGSEWAAAPLRPVAHWVLMPSADGRSRLQMVWETPDPIPPASVPA